MPIADPNQSIVVRRLRESDRAAWQPLFAGYLSFYRAQLSEADIATAFERLCSGERGMVGLVAVDAADRAIGIAHLVFHAATWSPAGYCYLEDLYVDPAHRGGQVAGALFDAVYACAAQRGVGRVYWATQQFNGAARSLYDTVGTLTSFVIYEHELG